MEENEAIALLKSKIKKSALNQGWIDLRTLLRNLKKLNKKRKKILENSL